ncbi:tryptophan-rich sensory protein [Shimia sp. R10_1]|nr:tryptophan-rich sensory protein [Shimia sp. R10_1]
MRVLLFMLVMGGGLSIGILTAPGAWYSALVKPDFNPPNWVFGPVWTALYAVIAMVGWRQFEARHAGGQWSLWRLQLGLNFAWSPVFFGLHTPWLAVVVIIALWVSIALFITRSWQRDRLSAWAFVPYLAWVSFATLLTVSIAILN